MWILPSQLLNSAPGMEALDLDSKTFLASECEPSHIVSLRGLLKPISSVKWKKDSWMSHLYGTILKPSHTNRFTDWWTSLLRDTLANHFPAQESEQEKKTQDISGLGSQMEFDFFNQECVSLKMSKDTFRWDSQQSSVIWKNWVTKVRSEYSVRLKSAQSTRGKECSSWPTIRVNQAEDCASERRRRNPSLDSIVKQNWPTPEAFVQRGPIKTELTETGFVSYHGNQKYGAKLSDAVTCGPHAPANHNTHGNRQESWATPSTRDHKDSATIIPPCTGKTRGFTLGNQMVQQTNWATPRSCSAMAATITEESANKENRFPNLETQVGRQQWATPNAGDAQAGMSTGRQQKTLGQDVSMEMKRWATPQASDHVEGARTKLTSNQKCLGRDMKQWGNPSAAKLNQRWVEILMGLPMGWTSPSCPASVIRNWPKFVSGWLEATTAPTNYDPAEVELFQLQQSERSEY